jgi:capsular exopolysaccharide synthesis family protein
MQRRSCGHLSVDGCPRIKVTFVKWLKLEIDKTDIRISPASEIAPMSKDEIYDAARRLNEKQRFSPEPWEDAMIPPGSNAGDAGAKHRDNGSEKSLEKTTEANSVEGFREQSGNGANGNEEVTPKNQRNNVIEIQPELIVSIGPDAQSSRTAASSSSRSQSAANAIKTTKADSAPVKSDGPAKNIGQDNGKKEAKNVPQSSKQVIRIAPDQESPLIINTNDPIASEAFGILRSRLLKACEQSKKTVLVTSAEQGEGKTVVAINLALSLAQLGQKRILLVDSDLRVCGVTGFLGLSDRYGLGDFLRSERPIEAVIHPTNYNNLSVVPAGQTPTKLLPEILEGGRWVEFINAVKEQFDLIVIDSLPITAPVVDLELLMAPCDGVLITVQIGKTRRSNLNRIARWTDKQKLLGVIVNNADKLKDGSYASSYYGRTEQKR